MMNMNDAIIREVRQEPDLKDKELVLICVNRDYPSMLEDAYLLRKDGTFQQLLCEANEGIDRADWAEIKRPENEEVLVEFCESRNNKKNPDGRPNGIRWMSEGEHFPCEVYYNSGDERVTVDGKWVAPGDFQYFCDLDPNSEEAKRMWDAYMRSPAVQEGIAEVQRAFEEKKKKEGRG